LLRTIVASSLVIGLLLGGKLSRLAEVRIVRLPWIIGSFVIKFTLVFLSGKVSPDPVLGIAATCLIYGMLIFGLSKNSRYPGFPLLIAGIVLNFIVIALNQGRMPVLVSLLDPVTCANEIASLGTSLVHQPLSDVTRAKFLADIFKWRFFSKIPTTFSVGDVLMAVGISWFLLHVMLKGFAGSAKDATIG